jgi:hypothetical protein
MTPAVAVDRPAELLEVGLALVADEVVDDRAQVLEVEQRQALLVGEVEDQPEAGLLGVVEAPAPCAAAPGPNDVMVARTGMPVPSPPSARNSAG